MFRSPILKALLFPSLAFLLLAGCSKKDKNPDPEPEPGPVAEVVAGKKDVRTFEVIELTVKAELAEKYAATFGTAAVELIRTSDSTLAFFVPDVPAGEHSLRFALNSVSFRVSATQVADPVKTVDEIMTAFDGQVSAMTPVTEEEKADVARMKEYGQEVRTLFNSLTAEQKRQTALFYEANKASFQAFKDHFNTNFNAPTALGRQSDCPTSFTLREFYSCTSGNLATAASELNESFMDFIELLLLAKMSAALSPASFGLSAGATVLAMGTAGYILLAELLPAASRFKTASLAFLKANWLLAKGVFLEIKKEFNNDATDDLGLDARLRSLSEDDTDISPETSRFISTTKTLNDSWNKITPVFGSAPAYQENEEPVTLTAEEISITEISNPDVQLVSQSGESVRFKSTSGEEETFSFKIKVTKESLYEEAVIAAKILAAANFELKGLWRLNHYTDGTRQTLSQSDLIDFKNGRADLGWPISYISYPDGQTHDQRSDDEDFTWNQTFSGSHLALTHNWWNVYYRFDYDSDSPNRLIGQSIGLSNNGYNLELVKQ